MRHPLRGKHEADRGDEAAGFTQSVRFRIQERERPGNDEPANENADHCPAMMLDRMAPRMSDRQRQRYQRENRQQMNGAERAPQPDFMNEKSLVDRQQSFGTRHT